MELGDTIKIVTTYTGYIPGVNFRLDQFNHVLFSTDGNHSDVALFSGADSVVPVGDVYLFDVTDDIHSIFGWRNVSPDGGLSGNGCLVGFCSDTTMLLTSLGAMIKSGV